MAAHNMLKNTIFFLVFTLTFSACSRKSTSLPTNSDNTNSVNVKFWMVSEEKSGKLPCQSDWVIPNRYRLVGPDTAYVYSQLRKSVGLNDSIDVELPMSNGSLYLTRIARSASIPLEFEAKYGISAYSGRLKELNGSTIRLEMDSSKGIRFMAISELGTTIMLRVCNQGPWNYLVFEKSDLPAGAKTGFE